MLVHSLLYLLVLHQVSHKSHLYPFVLLPRKMHSGVNKVSHLRTQKLMLLNNKTKTFWCEVQCTDPYTVASLRTFWMGEGSWQLCESFRRGVLWSPNTVWSFNLILAMNTIKIMYWLWFKWFSVLHAHILQVVRAAEVTNMRGGRFMSVEDIIFLMRKDKVSWGMLMDGILLWTLLNLQATHSLTRILTIFLLCQTIILEIYQLKSNPIKAHVVETVKT